MRALTRLASSALLLLFVGCASSGTSSSDSPPDTLTRADLLETDETFLYEAVRRLRPQWLRPRGAGIAGRTLTQVFVDGSPRGDASVLQEIRVINVAEVEFLSATDAATLFGTAASIGRAILVRTGGPGGT